MEPQQRIMPAEGGRSDRHQQQSGTGGWGRDHLSRTASGPVWAQPDLTDDDVLFQPSRILRGNSRGPYG